MSRRRYHSSEMSLDPKYARTLIGSGHYLAAVLYERGIDHADDWGRLRGDVAQFMLTVLPSCPETDEVIEEALNAVTAAGLWERYDVDGKTFIQYDPEKWERTQSRLVSKRRRKGSEATAKTRRAVLERDRFTCRHCGATSDLQVDHIQPVAKGGKGTMDNLQTLCQPCNRTKGVRA